MGGLSAGTWTRWPTKPVVESGLTRNLYELIKDGAFRSGQITSGSLTWTRLHSGEEIGSIGYSSDLTAPASGSVRLHYHHDGSPVDCRVSLTTTRPYFGGVRWRSSVPSTVAGHPSCTFRRAAIFLRRVRRLIWRIAAKMKPPVIDNCLRPRKFAGVSAGAAI